MYSLKDYEDKVLDALEPLLKEKGGYLRALKGYAGELASEEALTKFFVNQFPAVLVKVSSAEYEYADQECTRETVTVDLLIVSQSYQDQSEARGGSKGVYTILKDIMEKLKEKTLGLSIRPLKPVRAWELYSTPQVVFWAAQYQLINDCIESA